MTERAGDILNWLAAGALLPLMFLPFASLLRGKAASAGLFLAIAAAVIGGSFLFARLAVDIEPPTLSLAQMLAGAGGIAAVAALAVGVGAAPLAARLSAPIETFVRAVGRLSLYLILAMAAVTFGAVILRYVFGLNYIAMQESVTYMHGAVFLLAGGYALLTDDHVRVDIFYRDASPRQKAFVDLAGTYLLLFPFCLVAFWAAGPYVANSWAVREGSMEQSGIKGIYLLKSLIPVYLILLSLAGFCVATRAAAVLSGRSAGR